MQKDSDDYNHTKCLVKGIVLDWSYRSTRASARVRNSFFDTSPPSGCVGDSFIDLSILQSIAAYNQCTTRNPLIYQFRKNSGLVSVLLTVAYKKVKICHRIQWLARSAKYAVHIVRKGLPVSQPFGYRQDRTHLWCDSPKPVIGQYSQIAKVHTFVLVDIRRRVLPPPC